ncbi:Tetraacyldisaccharide 4'-kinase [invertebrate metagenome]|uniref:tetraacyldisaccharide 4'-kinase n=1 Tax=invertebrate metagenome TaxID=1711999 RepID=A0A2H9T8J4_9ZZZZ
MKKQLKQSILSSWYGTGHWTHLLSPLSRLFNTFAQKRRHHYEQTDRWQPPIPIIVVGNIAVGGTGKTPVVAALVDIMKNQGYTPGIISRGFGAKGQQYPVKVTPYSAPDDVGDEPVMLARQLNVPIVVDPDRVSAARWLCQHTNCDLIITDDGLQHYNLMRHIEIVVIDGQRLLGNGMTLPAGPLREPVNRLNEADFILVNGQPSDHLPIQAFDCFSLKTDQLMPLTATTRPIPDKEKIHAVAGIGHPQRFFDTLSAQGFNVIPHAFADHHHFNRQDICFHDDLPVVMTMKDMVKCLSFANDNHWYLPVQAQLPDNYGQKIVALLAQRLPQCQNTATRS